MMKISGTFLDEISHDIPHQNWGIKEWRQDFQHMKSVGIDTVILIRCGHQKWLTYPSKFLMSTEGCFRPPVDLVKMFLDLSNEFGFAFYFGLYDSGKYWWQLEDYNTEVEINLQIIDEVWQVYGNHSAFSGWYLPHEVSRKTIGIMDLYARLGKYCKEVSSGLTILISPYIDGTKAILSSQSELTKSQQVSIQQHEQEWNEIFDTLKDSIDIVAFQDGHVELDQLPDYFSINKTLAENHGLQCWTNAESFDRDMPIKFLPIKWEKLLLKLEAAQKAGMDKAITFEFSHFMSPQSSYLQAGHLYNRYREHFDM